MSDAPDNAFDPGQVELLLVDDDDEFRKTAAQRFACRGFRVQQASGVNDVLRQLQDRQFDVVVSDMAMPGLTGIDLLQRVKELSPECEAILLTGKGPDVRDEIASTPYEEPPLGPGG